MKINKLIFGIGAVSAIALPIVGIISCGDNESSTDKQKFDGITQTQAVDALKLNKNTAAIQTAKSANATNVEVNGLSGVSIEITKWAPNLMEKKVIFDIIIKESCLVKNMTSITASGYQAPVTLSAANIAKYAMWDSVKKTLSFKEGVNIIPNNDKLYDAYKSATKLTIPNSITEIEAFSFNKFTATTELSLGKSLITIDSGAFGSMILKTLIIPNNVVTIGSNAFSDSPLTTLKLSSSLSNIEILTFADARLTQLTIPKSIRVIQQNAFNNSTLTSLTFEGEVPTSIVGSIVLKIDAFHKTAPTAIKPAGWQTWLTKHFRSAFKT